VIENRRVMVYQTWKIVQYHRPPAPETIKPKVEILT